jgi:hypothetical protein
MLKEICTLRGALAGAAGLLVGGETLLGVHASNSRSNSCALW